MDAFDFFVQMGLMGQPLFLSFLAKALVKEGSYFFNLSQSKKTSLATSLDW